MSRVDDLVTAYQRFVALPWQQQLAPPQRVWMAVYPPRDERRLRLNVGQFANATVAAGHEWHLHDITDAFEQWMAGHDYAEAYFEDPDLLDTALPEFLDTLVDELRGALDEHSTEDNVVALLGAGTLFGLGDAVKVSALMNRINDAIRGRLLVFFPGHHEHNSYRLLDARDGWNYLATPILPEGSS